MSKGEPASAFWREPLRRLRGRTAATVHASPAVAGFSRWRQVAVIAAAGVFMTLASPFGTGEGPLWLRLVYWLGLFTAGTLLANLMVRVAVRLDLFERRPWLWAMLVTLVITPPMTVLVWAASGLMFIGALRPEILPHYVAPVLAVSLAMLALTVLTQRTPVQTHVRAEGAADAGEPAFLRRLPARLSGAELFAVQAEDHYLRLHTSRGQDLILMRLADAIPELEGLEGAQVHRSWWVAKAAVTGAERGNGRATLTLRGGAVAPVSRTYARALREQGWY